MSRVLALGTFTFPYVLLVGCADVLGTGFNEQVPDGATILCASDADCPDSAPRCVLARHVCVADGADATPPGLVSVNFEPRAARAGVAELVIVADEALADVAPEVRFAGSGAPALQLGGGTGAERRMRVDVDALEEGIYLVASVAITDRAGNHTDSPVDGAALEVDRTPPALHDMQLVDGPADGIYADIDSGEIIRTELTVAFAADDVLDLAATSISAGALTSDACAQSGAGATVRCVLNLADPLADDDVDAPIRIATADTAGNEVERVLYARIDAAAPLVASSNIAVEVAGVGAVSAALPGARVTVSIVTSEALGAAPTGAIVAGNQTLPLLDVEGAGAEWTLAADVTEVFTAPAGEVYVSLVDIAGHSAPLVALSDEVPFGNAIVSSCEVPAHIGCPDVDGDGVSPVLGCDAAPDCNDLDATVYPGALEIPGDGFANACTGADLPIDESVGVFLDKAAPSGGDGSRAAPFNNDQDVNTADPGVVFVRAGSSSATFVGRINRTVIGGLDDNWQADATLRSSLEVSDDTKDLELRGDHTYVRLFLDAGTDRIIQIPDRATFVSCATFDQTYVWGVLDAVDSALNRPLTIQPGGHAALVDTSATTLQADGPLRLVRARASDGVTLYALGQLTAVSSLIRTNTTVGATVRCLDCPLVRMLHSTVLRDPSTTARPVVFASGSGVIELRNNVLHQAADHPHLGFGADVAQWTLVNNVLSRSALGDALVENEFGIILYDTAQELNDCDDEGNLECSLVDNNVALGVTDDIGFIPADPPHLLLSSPAVDTASAAPSLLAGGDPPTLVTDIDGDCRYADGAADVGADEVGGG
jgi:hypothetical protein